MGCNCKANEHIFKIQKAYGKKTHVSGTEYIKFLTEELVKFILIAIILVPFIPLVAIYVLIMSITGQGKINLNTFVKRITNRKGDE